MTSIGLRTILCDLDFLAPNLGNSLLSAERSPMDSDDDYRAMIPCAEFITQKEDELPSIYVCVPSDEVQTVITAFFNDIDLPVLAEVGSVEDVLKQWKMAGSKSVQDEKEKQMHAGNIMVLSDDILLLLKFRREKQCQTVFTRSVIRTLDRIRRLLADPDAIHFSIDCRREFSISEADTFQHSYFWQYLQTEIPVMSIDYYGELCALLNQHIGWFQERIEGMIFAGRCAFCTDQQAIQSVNEIIKLELITAIAPSPQSPNHSGGPVPPISSMCDDPLVRAALMKSTQDLVLDRSAFRLHEEQDDEELERALEASGLQMVEQDEELKRALEASGLQTVEQDEELERVLEASLTQEEVHDTDADQLQCALRVSLEYQQEEQDKDAEQLQRAVEISLEQEHDEDEEHLQKALEASLTEHRAEMSCPLASGSSAGI